MNNEICKNCKYHFIEEISFDYSQSCCNKTNPCHTTEEWLNCDDFEYSKDYITNLREDLEISKDNAETYRLEMLEITKILGLDEHTLFDDVKNYAESLKQTLHNITINGVEEENMSVLDLIKENKRLKEEKQRLLYNLEKVCEEDEEDYNPYCETCETCGYIGCCGIRNFISEHIEGKTNCKNESLIISELINLCEYKDEVYQEKEDYKSRCEKANKFIDNNSHYYSTVKHNEGFSIDLDEEVFCNTLLNILNGSDEE